MAGKVICNVRTTGGPAPDAHDETCITLPPSLTTASARQILARYVEQTAPEQDNLVELISDACQAVERGEVLFFWNDRQILDLEEPLSLLGENRATFIHLQPLVGG